MTWMLRDLPPKSCKWGMDDPGPGLMDLMRLCGEPEAFDGCPWCKVHLAKAYPRPSAELRASWRLAQSRAEAFQLKIAGPAAEPEPSATQAPKPSIAA